MARSLPWNFVAGRPGSALLDGWLRRAEAASLSYDRIRSGGVGSTLEPGPAAPGVHRETAVVGRGPEDFAAAADALRRWDLHPGIGARIHRPDSPMVEGTSVLVVLPAGPLSLIVPNRVVRVVDEPHRFGFAYGTLDGHHERGEEGFVAELEPDGAVRCTISVDAGPASTPARLVGPAVVALSHAALRRYLRRWQHVVENSMAGGATSS